MATGTVSVLLFLARAGLAVAGAWLVVRDFPSLTLLLGIPTLGLAVALRPRSAGSIRWPTNCVRVTRRPCTNYLVNRP